MLRITRQATNGSDVTLKLEGKIQADWVRLLEQECRAASRQTTDITLDFSDVTFIDEHGVRMVQHLAGLGVQIINPPEFIGALLTEGGIP